MVKTAVILAAGLGSRLGNTKGEKPKGFVPVGATTLIDRSIGLLYDVGIDRIIIGTGYASGHYEQLAREYPGIECINNDRFRMSGSFYTLYNMRDAITDDFLLLESDIIYEQKALTALLHDSREDVILLSGFTESGDEVFVQGDSLQRLERMSKNDRDLEHITGELVGISKISLPQFRKLCTSVDDDAAFLQTADYESALVGLSRFSPFYLKKIVNLVWAEVDTDDHLQRVYQKIVPRIKELT